MVEAGEDSISIRSELSPTLMELSGSVVNLYAELCEVYKAVCELDDDAYFESIEEPKGDVCVASNLIAYMSEEAWCQELINACVGYETLLRTVENLPIRAD